MTTQGKDDEDDIGIGYIAYLLRKLDAAEWHEQNPNAAQRRVKPRWSEEPPKKMDWTYAIFFRKQCSGFADKLDALRRSIVKLDVRWLKSGEKLTADLLETNVCRLLCELGAVSNPENAQYLNLSEAIQAIESGGGHTAKTDGANQGDAAGGASKTSHSAADEDPNTEEPVLTEKHIACLKCLRKLRAKSDATRKTREKIGACVDPPHGNAITVAQAIPFLAKCGYVDSLKHRPLKGKPGGVFIAELGLARLKQEEANVKGQK